MFSKSKTQPPPLDVQESFNLWDMLNVRYKTINQVQIFENFVHDVDFRMLIKNNFYDTFNKQVKDLENLMQTYALPSPRRPQESARTPVNTEAFTDSFIADLFMTLLQENIGMHLRAVRTSVTSDDIRYLFIKFLFAELDIYELSLKYVKAKGWLGVPPIYPLVPHQGTSERLDSGEVYHLWDHLSARYDSMEITLIFHNYAHDGDLKSLLKIFLHSVLQKQVSVIEKEMDHFVLPLPERPPATVATPDTSQAIQDILIFRQIFTGIQNMFELHATALKQTTTNDRLRIIYKQFLKEELEIYDSFIKYGKLKGWIRHSPILRPGQG